jgi:hypothetical protein
MDRFHVHDGDSMQVEVLVDMLKYYKRRVNSDHYVRITEETEVLEPVTEQTIEQSIIN